MSPTDSTIPGPVKQRILSLLDSHYRSVYKQQAVDSKEAIV